MSKITLTNLANLENEASAVTVINNNSQTVQTAFDNTLSRDGTSPNQMMTDFDMNSHRILNLPAPVQPTDVVRLQELSTVTGGGTVSNIPAGGNVGDILTKSSSVNFATQWTSDASRLVAGNQIVITGTSPATIAITPTPTFTTVNGLTVSTTTGTLAVANAKTLTVNNTLTLSGTDTASINFAAGGTVAYTGTGLQQFAATTSAQLAGVLSDETGTGVVVFSNTPTLVTPVLGVATATSINKVSFTQPATGSTLTIADGKTLTTSNSLTFAGTDLTVITFQGTDTYVGRTTTDTLTNKTISGSNNTLSNIALSSLTNAAASTLIGNFTTSAAAPTATTIGSLTQKLSPAGTDLVLIQDQAASGQLKYATVSAVAAGSSVASVGGLTGTIGLTAPLTTSSNNIIIGGTTTAHGVALWEGAANFGNTGTGTVGQTLSGNGSSADPTFKSGAWTLLTTLTASNSATLGDTTTLTSSYNEYELVFESLIPATTSVACQFQVHSGGSFQTGAVYSYATGGSNVAGTFTSAGNSANTSILLTDGSSLTNTAPGLTGRIRISNPSVSGIHMWVGQFMRQIAQLSVGGWYNTSAVVDGFQVVMSSGNITSGTIKIYGRL